MLSHHARPQNVVANAFPRATSTGSHGCAFFACAATAARALFRRSSTGTYAGKSSKSYRLLFRRGMDIQRDELQNFFVAHFGQHRFSTALQDIGREPALRFDERVDLLLQCAAADELVHEHVPALADAK